MKSALKVLVLGLLASSPLFGLANDNPPSMEEAYLQQDDASADDAEPAPYRKEDHDPIFHTTKIAVKPINGVTPECSRREMGYNRLVKGKEVYFIGIVEYECNVVAHTYQLMCGVAWGHEDGKAVPAAEMKSGAATGDVKYWTVDPAKTDSLKLAGGGVKLGNVASDKIDQVAKKFFVEKCFPFLPK